MLDSPVYVQELGKIAKFTIICLVYHSKIIYDSDTVWVEWDEGRIHSAQG